MRCQNNREETAIRICTIVPFIPDGKRAAQKGSQAEQNCAYVQQAGVGKGQAGYLHYLHYILHSL